MSLLYAVTSCVGMICGPLIGRLIDRVGYKAVMVGDSFLIILVCLLYSSAHLLFPMGTAFIVVCITYVLDSMVSMGRMAASVYVRRIASDKEEVSATLSTGISVDHVISITMALAGGWIWRLTGFEVLFVVSAGIGLAKSLYTLTIKKNEEN
jgi:MFS family permease